MKTVAMRGQVVLSLAAAVAGVAMAGTLPDPIKNVSGSSEDSARSVMTQHGYTQRSEKTSWGRKLTYWWSDKAHQCVLLTSLAGRVLTVDAKGESDCRYAPVSGTTGALIDPQELVGLPRSAVEARLARAGFKPFSSYTKVDVNDSRGDVTDIWWVNDRQCLAGNVANDRYEMLQSMPLNQCRK